MTSLIECLYSSRPRDCLCTLWHSAEAVPGNSTTESADARNERKLGYGYVIHALDTHFT
ncbi:hypothetical protein M378DRAFT_160648 [Amanita muscaria Koide BX008]|uniref:Uncharacterized protein n=1 Tax=Amanita muscaria (strain Koide BX008) TaxID=946122 RepID=A0A0C2XCS4_AMAMK|nr:hypothetical protein M378DRAFT_160648 [Amanita muscaria Koide BX008]